MNNPAMRIASPEDLITATPYLLGYKPNDSVVITFMTAGTVAVTVRLDLPLAEDLIEPTIKTIRRDGTPEAAYIVGYRDTPIASAELNALANAILGAGIDIREAFWVAEERFGSMLCTEPRCCPPGGRPIPAATKASAEATYAGLSALPDRDSIKREIAPEADEATLQERTVGLTAELDSEELLQCLERASERLDLAHAIGFATTVSKNVTLRDAAWLYIERVSTTTEATSLIYDQLRSIARRVPAAIRPSPLFLAAWAAWRGGDVVRATIAVEAALAIDPGHKASNLLAKTLVLGLNPATSLRLV